MGVRLVDRLPRSSPAKALETILFSGFSIRHSSLHMEYFRSPDTETEDADSDVVPQSPAFPRGNHPLDAPPLNKIPPHNAFVVIEATIST